jgi:hypothetical protein
MWLKTYLNEGSLIPRAQYSTYLYVQSHQMVPFNLLAPGFIETCVLTYFSPKHEGEGKKISHPRNTDRKLSRWGFQRSWTSKENKTWADPGF